MCLRRVAAHHEVMYTNYDFTRALVIDRQRELREHARPHHLAALGRRARRAHANPAAEPVVSTLHYLPTPVRPDDRETRAAS